jgi:hypothetical protein
MAPDSAPRARALHAAEESPGQGEERSPAPAYGLPVANRVAPRSGWITFAGIAALVAGSYNTLSGIAALSDDDTLSGRAKEVLFSIDLTAWGWFWLIVGLVQLVTGVLILQRNMAGLWLGVAAASLSGLMTVFVIFVFPLWGIAVLSIDFLVLFALLTQADEFA